VSDIVQRKLDQEVGSMIKIFFGEAKDKLEQKIKKYGSGLRLKR
jgi:hypothetical protein